MFKKLLFVFAGLLVTLVVIGFFLPNKYEIHAERVVHGSPAEIHAIFADLKTWPEWTIWSRHADPTCEWKFEGEPGKGMSMSWIGEELSTGNLTISESSVEKGTTYTMNMEGMSPLTGHVTYEAVEGGTKVVWHDEGSMDIPVVGGFLVMAFGGMMDEMFETNLNNLDDRIHAAHGHDHGDDGHAVEASAKKK